MYVLHTRRIASTWCMVSDGISYFVYQIRKFMMANINTAKSTHTYTHVPHSVVNRKNNIQLICVYLYSHTHCTCLRVTVFRIAARVHVLVVIVQFLECTRARVRRTVFLSIVNLTQAEGTWDGCESMDSVDCDGVGVWVVFPIARLYWCDCNSVVDSDDNWTPRNQHQAQQKDRWKITIDDSQ